MFQTYVKKTQSCQFYVANFISYSNYNNINLCFRDVAVLFNKWL